VGSLPASTIRPPIVIPAQAGIQGHNHRRATPWIPACAGMTDAEIPEPTPLRPTPKTVYTPAAFHPLGGPP
jgi:hypothetical protein